MIVRKLIYYQKPLTLSAAPLRSLRRRYSFSERGRRSKADGQALNKSQMKDVRRIGILAIVLLIAFFSTNAQDKQIPPAADRAAKMTEWMKTNLQLTAEQEPKVQDINLKYANKADQLRNSSLGKRQKMQSLKADSNAKDQELKAVLTPSQYSSYESKKAEVKKKFKEKAKENR